MSDSTQNPEDRNPRVLSDDQLFNTFHVSADLRQRAYEINLRLQAERDGSQAITGRMQRAPKPLAPQDAPQTEHPSPAPKWRYRINDNPGWIYVIRSGAEYKIGSSVNVSRRVRVLMADLIYESQLVLKFRVDAMYTCEHRLHELYEDKRTHGEWFALDNGDLEAIRSMYELDNDKKSVYR